MKLHYNMTSAKLVTDHVIGLFSNEALVAVYNKDEKKLCKLIDLHKSPANSLHHVENLASSLGIAWENVSSTTQITLQKRLIKGLTDEL